jgi:hypothetical protein
MLRRQNIDAQRGICEMHRENFPEPKTPTTRYSMMECEIHIDEKWFLSREGIISYYVSPNDLVLWRYVQNKGKIQKVMFLCAVARPRLDPESCVRFNGKIGIWPIGERVEAERNPVNCPAGTLVWKNNMVTKDRFKRMR